MQGDVLAGWSVSRAGLSLVAELPAADDFEFAAEHLAHAVKVSTASHSDFEALLSGLAAPFAGFGPWKVHGALEQQQAFSVHLSNH